MSEGIDPIEDRYSAIHEAGHAVAAILLDLGLREVSIGKRRLASGMLIGGGFQWEGVALPDLAGKGDLAIPPITLYLAGPVAERKINPKAINPAALSDDFLQALKMAGYASGVVTQTGPGRYQIVGTQPAQMAMYQKGSGRGGVLVDDHWSTIEAFGRSPPSSPVDDGWRRSAQFLRDRERPNPGALEPDEAKTHHGQVIEQLQREVRRGDDPRGQAGGTPAIPQPSFPCGGSLGGHGARQGRWSMGSPPVGT